MSVPNHTPQPEEGRVRDPTDEDIVTNLQFAEATKKIDSASPSALFATHAWAVASILYGLAIIWGGPSRWNGPAYFALNQLPAAPYPFGVAFIVFSIMVLVGCRAEKWTLRNTGIWGLCVLFLCFSGCFAYAAIVDGRVSPGGSVIFAAVSLHLMVLRRLRGPTA
jgi:hypothetical protein